MKIHRNTKSKGPSAVRCAGFPKFSHGAVRMPRPSTRRLQRTPSLTAEMREARLAPLRRDRAKIAAIGLNPRYRGGNKHAIADWKRREKQWESDNRSARAEAA